MEQHVYKNISKSWNTELSGLNIFDEKNENDELRFKEEKNELQKVIDEKEKIIIDMNNIINRMVLSFEEEKNELRKVIDNKHKTILTLEEEKLKSTILAPYYYYSCPSYFHYIHK